MASPPGSIHPSVPLSDTPYASEPASNQVSPFQPSNSSPAHGQDLDEHHTGRPRLPSVSYPPRTRTETITSSSSSPSSPVRRKPLPSTASPLATRFSSGEHLTSNLQLPEVPFARPYSVDSPTLHEFPPTSKPFSPARNVDHSNANPSPERPALTAEHASAVLDTNLQHLTPSPKSPSLSVPGQPSFPTAPPSKHARLVSESALTSASDLTSPWVDSDTSSVTHTRSTMSIFSAKPTPPHTLSNAAQSYSDESNDPTSTIQKELPSLPKSPGTSKLGSFFGWGGNISPASSTTTFSDKSISPIPSPNTSTTHRLSDVYHTANGRNKPTAINVPKANAEAGSYFGNPHLQLPLATPSSSGSSFAPVQIEEMEKELKEISSELAASIRREMDLEDLVDRLQAEAQNTQSPGKRTSDYYSDSGTSSVRYGGETDKQDELDRMIRKTEQDKAQMRLELSTKVQEERGRRKQLESQIKTLEERASHADFYSINSLDANGRLRDLESTCEDLRRRLTEERQVKENFEDLLTALKGELQNSHNERDNLRDEIVPQLRARVEGLEAQAAEHEKLTYEHSKMQQDLQTLKNENVTLINAQRMQSEMQQQMKKFSSITEEGVASNPRANMSRSNSVTQGGRGSRPSSLSRSATVKTTESREALAERVKDVELQRDSLHKALKNLLERQEHQNRENQKRIRQLELERDKALAGSPKRVAYDREVANLREEINTLRRRADEAIEQKWQCEKGLSGLKMDLDRAEQEIGSLRMLLQEKDILLTSGRARSGSGPVSSESLERSYKDLQIAYADSLERIKNLEISGSRDMETERAMKALEKSLAQAISETEFAKQDAHTLRDQTHSLRDAEKQHVGAEAVLADELHGSAKRVEELANQVRQQLSSNATLRRRLAETVERGEMDQKANAQKIMFMQSKLKSLEDQLMATQQASEERLSRHEEDVRELKEAHSVQLFRMKETLRSPRAFSAKSPMSPLFSGTNKSPRVSQTTSGKAMSVSQDSQMDVLKARVGELEAALTEADQQMEEVVGRMNVAQIKVMELQNEREEAVRETKRLQTAIEAEKVNTFNGKWATMSS